MPLSDQQRDRYARQLVVPGFGERQQERLQGARVLLVGIGGLGSPAALYLAASGVGTIGIIDADEVELSNLGRQVLFSTAELGRLKVAAAQERIESLNPEVKVWTYPERGTEKSLAPLVTTYDFVLDCTDNLESKFVINDVCVKSRTPFSHAGALKLQGQLMTVVPGESACLRCLFPDQPSEASVPSPSEAGVAGFVPGIIGAMQAAEAVRYLLGIGELLTGRLLALDATSMRWREVGVPRNPGCPVCRASTREPEPAAAPT